MIHNFDETSLKRIINNVAILREKNGKLQLFFNETDVTPILEQGNKVPSILFLRSVVSYLLSNKETSEKTLTEIKLVKTDLSNVT